jgi:hypothetical protein
MDDVFTVHPFDDEWTWDSKTSGSHPWATASLEEAINHANLVRLEYASESGVDPAWIAGFWSSIYDESEGSNSDVMVGWVDPSGVFTEGPKPPLDEKGNWKGE